MIGLPKAKNGVRAKLRRKSDIPSGEAEIAVLEALHVSARRSSPHKAATRAGIARALSIIETAMAGLLQIRELIDECNWLCVNALSNDDPEKRASLAERYAGIITELNAIAEATGHSGVHLINGSNHACEIDLGRSDDLKMKLPQINLTSGTEGLALPTPAKAFADAHSLHRLRQHLEHVQKRVDHSSHLLKEYEAAMALRLAMVLEYAIPEEHELYNVPQAPETRWASRV